MQNNEETKARFGSIMLGLAENYGQTFTLPGIEMRFKALMNYSLKEIENAAIAMLNNRKYTTMPTVADFKEYLSGGPVEDKAEIEAGKVLGAITRYGSYRSVVFDNPVTMAVIARAYGGWIGLCEKVGVELTENWFRKEFVKIWASYNRQEQTMYGHLPGRSELENSLNGHSTKEFLAIVGDKQKAKAIYESGKKKALGSVSHVSEIIGGLVAGLPQTPEVQ